jgi:glycosyltransferase involved in cell wall biosynthesis
MDDSSKRIINDSESQENDMKVLAVINSLAMGGAEKLLINLYNGARDVGHSLKVVTLLDEVKYKIPSSSDFIIGISGLKQYGGILQSAISYIRSAQALSRIVNTYSPDCLYVHLGHSAAVASLIRYDPEIVRLYHIHGDPAGKNSGPKSVLFLTKRFIKNSNGVIVNSSFVYYRSMKHYDLSSSMVYLIPNCIQSQDYDVVVNSTQARKELGLPLSHKIIVCVGRLSQRRAQSILIQATNNLCCEGRDILTILIGDGESRTVLEKQIDDLGLHERVILAGNQHNISKWLYAADLYVNPTYVETFGIALVEACAAGKAIVASDVGGIPEIIEHGKTGILFTPGDIDGLTESIKMLLDNPEMRETMGTEARRMAMSRYTPLKFWNSLENTIRTIQQMRSHV